MLYQHLMISNIKGLKECMLSNLGKINVFCGKNSSGKSTVLEGISNQSSCFPSFIFDNPTAQNLFDGTYERMGWGSQSPTNQYNTDYLSALNLIVEDSIGVVWNASNLWKIPEFIASEFNKTYWMKNFSHKVHGNLITRLETMIPRQQPSMLISAKRSLSLEQAINSTEGLSPNGSGVLNRLFYLKNQIDGTTEKIEYDKIKQAFYEISSGFTFDIIISGTHHSSCMLRFADKTNRWINAADCGLGLQDLLVILTLCIHAQEKIMLIEEPENHMHPNMQKKLLHFLANETDKQYFITTHSNIFLNNTIVDKIFFTKFEEDVSVDDATSRAAILNDIGYSITDNLVSDLIILVEGPSDKPVIEEFLLKMGMYDKFNIKIWPLGGDIMSQLDLTVFADKYSILAIIDNDPKSDRVRSKFTQNCSDLGITVRRLERYAIENYFSLKALRAVFGSQIDETLTDLNPALKIEEQIGINPKKNNHKIAKAMELSEIEGTDFYDFLKLVEETCNRNSEVLVHA